MGIEEYSFVVSGKFRKKVFLELKRKTTPSQIAKDAKVSTTQVSRTLKQLEKKGLVECLTPRSKMGKIYALTDKGKELLKEIEMDLGSNG